RQRSMRKVIRLVFRTRLRQNCRRKRKFEEAEERLAGVESQRRVVEQSLKRPASGEVNADAAGSLADAGTDFEQLGAQSFDLGRAPRLRQLVTCSSRRKALSAQLW